MSRKKSTKSSKSEVELVPPGAPITGSLLKELVEQSVDVRFSLVGHDYEPITPVPGDVGYDVRAPEDIWLPHGCRREVNLGLIVECPQPLFVLMAPRSSSGTKRLKSVRISNTFGVIDPRYRGQNDVITAWLERESAKQECVGRLKLDTPTRYKPIAAQAYDAFGVPMDQASTKFVRVSDEGYGVYDVFTSVEEPDLICEEGQAFLQMLFIPATQPTLERVQREMLQSKDRGGYGSTGR